MAKIVVTLMLLTLVGVWTWAQPQEILFRHIKTENGLTNDMIHCVVQDTHGYVWIGTDEGLNRYDGYECDQFEHNRFDEKSLIDNAIVCLYTDSKHRLWVGTLNGLCRFNSEQENFDRFVPEKTDVFINTANRVTGIRENIDGNLYVTTEIGKLYLLADNELREVRDFSQYGNIKDFEIDGSGVFWIGARHGLVRYNPTTNEVKHISCYRAQGQEVQLSMTRTLFDDGVRIWVGTDSGQTVYFYKKDLTSSCLVLPNIYITSVNDIFMDAEGTLHVATNGGLYKLDRALNVTEYYYFRQDHRHGISNSTVNSIYQDRQDNYWYGTQQGLNLAMNAKGFRNYNNFSNRVKLDITNVQSLAVDAAGNYWLGSYHSCINVVNMDKATKQLFMPRPGVVGSLGQSSVICLFEDRQKNMWVGSYADPLQRYDPKTGRFVNYHFTVPQSRNPKALDVRSMVEDAKGNLWMISHGTGLIKFNSETGQYKGFCRDPQNPQRTLADDYGTQIINDHDSLLWIATPSGLSKFDLATETFHNYYHQSSDSTSLSNNQVTSVFCDSLGNIWVGTSYGLNLMDRKRNCFYHFFEDNGLPSNQIKSFLEEKPGTIWMGTGYGLSRLTYQRQMGQEPVVTFRNYNRADHLQDIFFWSNAAVKHPNGDMAFGTESGLLVFRPDRIHDNPNPPSVYITELQLFNQPVKIGDSDSLLHSHISQINEIRLRHDQNIITLKFVAINHIAPENNRYAYRLENFSDQWAETSEKREVTYTNLPPGTYRFQVKASNNDGVWNHQGASLTIVVLPPWWQTWWFRVLLYSVIVVFAASLYLLREMLFRHQQRKLTQLVGERTRQLEENTLSLEEKQHEINAQNDELRLQRDELGRANEVLQQQQEQILIQHKELVQHRFHLEQLVAERTAELVAAKEKAEEADRLKSSFLANFSHEIRTPLNALLGFSALMSEPDLNSEEREQFGSIIHHNSNTLLELINDILDISKMEAGQMQLVMQPVQINAIVNNLIGTFELLLKRPEVGLGKSVKLRLNIPDSLMHAIIVADRLRLEQVLSNLISNALKFTAQGTVEIGCERLSHQGVIRFYVKDTGIGIKDENLELIFGRFRKVEDDASQLFRGNGLGLAISSHLVQLMGGTMTVESKVGVGSVFYFTLPDRGGVN
ncbi:MAG: hypothetical protein JXR39_02670 [Marinilabiliaceae bacterium]|nr:hypothetical protein [Marinilabiliaceae bacterium]